MKHQRCRCLGGITISHTQQQTAAVIPFCTAITMQDNSYAIRSQSVLTTNSTGRVYKVQFKCRARHSLVPRPRFKCEHPMHWSAYNIVASKSALLTSAMICDVKCSNNERKISGDFWNSVNSGACADSLYQAPVADPGVGQVGPGPPKLAQLKF